MKYAFFVLLLILFSPLVLSATFTCSSCSTCTSTIKIMSEGDILEIENNLAEPENNCINFAYKDDIVLDCLGHTLEGTNYYYMNHTGIDLTRTYRNIVRNCVIQNFFIGIDNDYSENNTFENVEITSSLEGVRFVGGNGNLINDSYIYNNHNEDIVLGSNCTDSIIDTRVSGGDYIGYLTGTMSISDQDYSSLFICEASDSVIENVRIQNGDGLRVVKSENLTFVNLFLDGNRENYIGESSQIIINDSVVADNDLSGIIFYDVQNLFIDNLTSENNVNGIEFSESYDVEFFYSFVVDNEIGFVLKNSNMSLYGSNVNNDINYFLDSNSSIFEPCVLDSDCDNGFYCDGVETCVDSYCVTTKIVVNDNVGCTTDYCDEDLDSVFHVANDSYCDDGIWCTGTETCNITSGCVTEIEPGVVCTDVEFFGLIGEVAPGSVPVRYSALGLDVNCWYNVKTITGATIISDTVLPSCSNSSFLFSQLGTYVLNLFANNSYGSFDVDSINFLISQVDEEEDDGGSSGGGGSSVGSSKTTNSNEVAINIKPFEIFVIAGEKNEFFVSVENIGKTVAKNCVLICDDKYKKYFNSSGSWNIFSGEIIDLYFFIDAIDDDVRDLKFSIKCDDGIKKVVPMDLVLIDENINISSINISIDGETVLLSYSASFNNETNETLTFRIFDSNDNLLSEYSKSLSPGENSSFLFEDLMFNLSGFEGQMKIEISNQKNFTLFEDYFYLGKVSSKIDGRIILALSLVAFIFGLFFLWKFGIKNFKK